MQSNIPLPIIAITDPASGHGASGLKLRLIKSLMDSQKGFIEWKMASKIGEATEITRLALENGAGIIASFGNDQMHNEVVNGFFDSRANPINSKAILSIVNQNYKGDLYRALGSGKSFRQNMQYLMHESIRAIDIGKVTYVKSNGDLVNSHFINVASAGISGVYDRLVNNFKHTWLGNKATSALSFLRAFKEFSPSTLDVVIDNKAESIEDVLCFIVANGCYIGNGMKIAPDAILDDGYFDIVCLGKFSRNEFLFKSSNFYTGTHMKLKKVWHKRAREISIKSNSIIPIDIDGISPGQLPLQIKVLPKIIRTLVGPNAAIRKQT